MSRRIEFLTPAGDITDKLLSNLLSLIGMAPPPPERMARLTELERLLAYDWAAREHLRD